LNWKPERISSKVVFPLVLVVTVSLGVVFVLLTQHTRETVIRLNTAALQLETKRLYHFCEKAVEELITDQQFGNPAFMNTKKDVVLSEIENHLLSEGIDGLTAIQQNIILSTIEVGSKLEFSGANGTLEISNDEGLFYGYYLYFPVWEWYLVTLLHEKPYWASHARIKLFLIVTGIIYISLALFVLFLLFFGLQRPLSMMVKQLNKHGKIILRTGTKELDLLASTINSQLEAIQEESEAKVERKKLEHELEIARKIQTSLLPARAPRVNGLDIAAIALPAKQVGGDFFDFIPLSENRLGLVIADVSGKGVPAALIMALSRALIRVNATQEHSITAVVQKTNTLIQEFASLEYFVTLFYAILAGTRDNLQYVRAGHNPPILYRPVTDEIIFLKGNGIALGVVKEIELEAKQIDLKAGDTLLLFTDGATEAINPLYEEFGVDRLCELLRRNHRLKAVKIVDEIKNEINKYADSNQQFDDITLMVLKV